MKISRMDKRIEILRPVTEEDKYGGMITKYIFEGYVWAQLVKANYGNQEALGTAMNREELRFKLRPAPDITRGWLVVYLGENYVVDTVDRMYRDSITLIVRRYEQGV
jgi:SPP1 family predicted phage head-tail adaptor